MSETAINVPFDASEIKDIAVAEFRKRLEGLGPLQLMKEYAGFSLVFNVTIRLRRVGEASEMQTLAWSEVTKGEVTEGQTEDVVNLLNSTFDAKDPNEERMERGMEMTVETRDGRGSIVRKKVHVKG